MLPLMGRPCADTQPNVFRSLPLCGTVFAVFLGIDQARSIGRFETRKVLYKMKNNRHRRYKMPKTVDEAAELLISDLSIADQDVLGKMSDEDFDHFYRSVAGYILEDFEIWRNNAQLMASSFEDDPQNDATHDPAKIILKRVREKLQHAEGVVIVT
jgi:hypothetical protein